jgi:6-phosphogluconolactonase (cycloisomerase 2 family)
MRTPFLTAALFALALLSGACGKKAAPRPRFLFATDTDANQLSVFSLDEGTGALHEITGSPFTTTAVKPTALAYHAGGFLYVAHDANQLSAFAVDPATGALVEQPNSPHAVTAGTISQNLALAPSGVCLYTLGSGSGVNISGYKIDLTSGALTVAGTTASGGTNPGRGAIDPQSRFLFVTNQSSASVSAFRIDPVTCDLTAVSGSPFTAGNTPTGVAIDPGGRILYVANDSDATISVYRVDTSTGAISGVPGSPFTTANPRPSRLAVATGGDGLYCTHVGTQGVSLYAVDPLTGALSPRNGATFPPGNGYGAGLLVDSGGRFLYVANNDTKIYAYGISAGNALATLFGSPFTAGAGISALAGN